MLPDEGRGPECLAAYMSGTAGAEKYDRAFQFDRQINKFYIAVYFGL